MTYYENRDPGDSYIYDALVQESIEDPGVPDYVMASSYGGGVSRFNFGIPSNTSVDITVETEDFGTSVEYSVTGNNISDESGAAEDGDVFSLTIPPAASEVVVEFTMFNTTYDETDPSFSDVMGRLTFSNINIPDLVVQGDLLMFGATDGVRVINAELASQGIFPRFGASQALFVKSGVVTKKGNINIGSILGE